jgi:SAM-dependent methyltransferase
MSETFEHYRQRWAEKPLLRRLYNDFYDRIANLCIDGRTVEIGGGIGEYKRRFPHVITTDIQAAPWLDIVADAQRLPFADGSISNIIMVDVLHHLEFPVLFLREAGRVLRPNGRCIMVEPGITWGSTLPFRLIHHEPVRMKADPLVEGRPNADRSPYDSNQAIPTLLAGRDRARLAKAVPSLSLVRTDWFSIAVYPLSGGFSPWSVLTDRAAKWLLPIEKKVEPFLGKALGSRLLLMFEKRTS